ncbi:NRT1 PTR FAMILY -like [Olea europaea subsp. europaea]|nr:NRT1 PTR FAMILY -like [Olea europaea subsp. europaea]
MVIPTIPTREGEEEPQESWIHGWIRCWPVFAFGFVAIGIHWSFDLLTSHAKFCDRNDPMCSAIFDVVFVIQIAVLKRYIVVATTERKRRLNSLESSTRIRISWWSDKDPFAIEEENRPGKTCTVAQMKESKKNFGVVPIWTTFLIFSLVEATGSIFFVKQASNIDDKFPVTVFLILVTVTSFAIDYLCDFLFRKIGNEMNGQLIMQWRIGVGMAFSFISCIFAYKNAVHWLDLVKIYKQPSMHMDIFCLTPQFLLLGIMKGLSERGLQSFFRSLLSESLRDYRTPFGECVMGIGKFLSTLCILRFKSWFGHDMDSSCLDNFYAILTILSFVNLLVFWVALVNYYGDDQFSPQAVDSEQPIEGTQDSFGPSVLLSFSDQTPHNLKYISVSKRRTQSLPDMMPNNPPYISVSPRITRSFSVSACPITPKLDDAHTQEIEQQH